MMVFKQQRIRTNFVCAIDVVYPKSCMMMALVHLRHFLTVEFKQQIL